MGHFKLSKITWHISSTFIYVYTWNLDDFLDRLFWLMVSLKRFTSCDDDFIFISNFKAWKSIHQFFIYFLLVSLFENDTHNCLHAQELLSSLTDIENYFLAYFPNFSLVVVALSVEEFVIEQSGIIIWNQKMRLCALSMLTFLLDILLSWNIKQVTQHELNAAFPLIYFIFYFFLCQIKCKPSQFQSTIIVNKTHISQSDNNDLKISQFLFNKWKIN